MKRKETYLSRDFRETAALRFPAQAKELNTAFDMRLSALLAENADASKEKQYHLKRQILPGISAYETLQRVMPKEEALQTVHGYVERLARTSHKQLAALLHIPGLYRLVPGVFVKSTRSVFGPAAGFAPKELQTGNGGYDEVSLSRHLRRIRLPGAVPLLLRQRRHQLYRAASEADLGENHDAWAR